MSDQELAETLLVRAAELNAAVLAAVEAGLKVKILLNDSGFLSTIAGARFLGSGSPSVSVKVYKPL